MGRNEDFKRCCLVRRKRGVKETCPKETRLVALKFCDSLYCLLEITLSVIRKHFNKKILFLKPANSEYKSFLWLPGFMRRASEDLEKKWFTRWNEIKILDDSSQPVELPAKNTLNAKHFPSLRSVLNSSMSSDRWKCSSGGWKHGSANKSQPGESCDFAQIAFAGITFSMTWFIAAHEKALCVEVSAFPVQISERNRYYLLVS